MEILYAVPWIEIEYGWGSRPESYKIFDNLEECIRSTNESSENDNYENGSGYFGPERPLCYYEIPKESVDSTKPCPFYVDNLQFKSTANQLINNIS